MANVINYKDVELGTGDIIRVQYKIIEKERKAGATKRSVNEEIKERIQPFEGILIAIRGVAENKSIVVRKIGADNVGIERIFPFSSPWIANVKLVKKGKVRRAKLYYLRDRPASQQYA